MAIVVEAELYICSGLVVQNAHSGPVIDPCFDVSIHWRSQHEMRATWLYEHGKNECVCRVNDFLFVDK